VPAEQPKWPLLKVVFLYFFLHYAIFGQKRGIFKRCPRVQKLAEDVAHIVARCRTTADTRTRNNLIC
jgi:hypothetical protein